jgi:hypothetical protein
MCQKQRKPIAQNYRLKLTAAAILVFPDFPSNTSTYESNSALATA